MTFEDIEKEFNFSKPLSDYTRTRIIERFGTIENYKTFVEKTINYNRSGLSDRVNLSIKSVEYILYKTKPNKILNGSGPAYWVRIPNYYGSDPQWDKQLLCAHDEYILDAADNMGYD